jgi:hypothetical protein
VDVLDPVDINEKQFFLSEVITSFILVPGEAPPIHLCKHKSHIQKATMCLTAIACPHQDPVGIVQRRHLEKGARAKRTTDKVNRKLPSRTKLGIVAVEQQIRSDQRHFLPRQDEHTRFQESNQSSIHGFFTKKTTATSCHCELVQVEQATSEARLRQHDPSKGKCA